MENMLKKIEKTGIIPVVVIDDAKDAEALSDALCRGGLACAEVTFRTAAAYDAIKIIKKKHPEMLLGAGTVLTPEQADRAVEAGAEFIVSPGLNPRVVQHCLDKNIPIVPGTCTPSDVEMALELGLKVVKFFPAEAAGGMKMINAIGAAYVGVKFLPTGGINASIVRDYLASDKILACGGSWMVKGNLIKDGKFDEIEKMTKEAVEIVKEMRG